MEHFQILLSLISLFGLAKLIQGKDEEYFSLSLINASIAVSFTLYFFAFFNQLEIGVQLLRTLGIAGIFFRIRKFNFFKIKLENLYIISNIVIFYIFCQTKSYAIFPFIDDYNHWGKMSLYIYEKNRLVNTNDDIGMKDYPPNAALFHYFFTYFSGFKDSIVIYANGILSIIISSPLLFFVNYYDKSNKKYAYLFITLSIYSLFWIFGLGLHSLWADLLLGLSFGIILFIYFNFYSHSKNAALIACFPLLCLCVQLKQIGILFSLFALIIFSISIIINKDNDSNTTIKNLSLIALFSLLIILIKISWDFYLSNKGVVVTSSTDISISKIFEVFNPNTVSERSVLTRNNFIDHILFKSHLSTYWLMLTSILLIYLVKFNNLKISNTDTVIYCSIYVFYIAYLAILLILYVLVFGEWEGVRLASIERYIITYILGILIFFGGGAIKLNILRKNSLAKFISILICLLLVIPNIGRIATDFVKVILNEPQTSTAERISSISNYVTKNTPKDSHVYVVWSDGSNDEGVIFSYFLRPRKINPSCIFLRPPHSEVLNSDIWSCKISGNNFKVMLENYDYIIFANPSNEFITYYAPFLGLGNDINNKLFKIHKKYSLELTPI